MPLSENEQRQLEAIERALRTEDPKFAATLHGSDLRSHNLRRLRRSIAVFALGVALLACIFLTVWLAVAGFAVMFLGLLGIVSAVKRLSGRETGPVAARLDPTVAAHGARSSWLERVEERWRRRWDERD